MLKIRERRTFVPATNILVDLYADPLLENPNQNPINTYVVGTEAFQTLHETMTPNSGGIRTGKVVPGSPSAARFTTWKSFQHHKAWSDVTRREDLQCEINFVRVHPLPPSSTSGYGVRKSLADSNFANQYGESGYPIVGLPDFLIQGEEFIVEPPADLEEFITRALKVLVPKIRSRLSLINSIIELKDLVTLKRSIEGIISIAQKWVRPNNKRAVLRQILRSTADGYLQKEFNFQPLASDMRGVQAVFDGTLKRMRALVANDGRPVTTHFRFEWPEFSDSSSTYDTIWSTESTFLGGAYAEDLVELRRRRIVKYEPSRFHCQLQYNANFTGAQLEHSRGLAILDGLGVNLDPSIIWNAIPWSFIVDWFVNVGEYLSRWKLGWLDPQINILQFLWSVRRERKVFVTLEEGSIYPSIPPPMIGVTQYPVFHETAYRRQVGLPSASSILSSGLSPKEFSLAAALAITRKPRYKNRKRQWE